MNVVEEISKLVLVVLVAILVLHIVTKGSGTSWLTSKFSVLDTSSDLAKAGSDKIAKAGKEKI